MSRKIIIANKVYIPVELVPERRLKRHYDHDIYVEQTCKKCPIMKNELKRPAVFKTHYGKVFNCLDCSWGGYTGHFVSYGRITIKGRDYWTVPSGDLPLVAKRLKIDLSDARDIRCRVKAKYRLNFTKKLFTGKEMRNGKPSANQKQMVRDFAASPGKTGVLKAKPRAGKTVIGVYIIVKMGYQSVVMAHEKLLLNQFYKTFVDFTDLERAEKRAGKKLVVIVKNEKDLKSDAPILLINYQKLISEMGVKRVAKYLIRKRGAILVDEIHRSSTDRYNDLLNRLDCAHKIGVTATDNRKDGRYVLTQETLGRVVAESSVEAMTPVVYLKETAFVPKRQWRGRMAYTKATGWLAEHKERNIDVIKQVFKDLRKDPQHSIVIPVLRVQHARKLTRMINKQAAYNNTHKGEKWPEELAEMLWGGLKNDQKEELLDRARRWKTRVVITIAKFVRDGIDVPAWTHMYVLFPGSNVENSYQNTQRICTPYEGKRTPIIRLWHDPVDIMKNCVKNTYNDSYIPLNYKIGKDSKEKLDLLSNSVKIGKSWIDKNKDLKAGWGAGADMTLTVRTR